VSNGIEVSSACIQGLVLLNYAGYGRPIRLRAQKLNLPIAYGNWSVEGHSENEVRVVYHLDPPNESIRPDHR
jgi:hypothetical protein